MRADHILLAVFWILYCGLHSLLAAVWVKQRAMQWMGEYYKYYRLFYTAFAFLTLALLVIYQTDLVPVVLFRQSWYTVLGGVLLGVAGLVVMGICIRKYFVGLSGILSLVQEESGSHLQVSGIHRYIRHPLYLGTFGFIWGLFLLVPHLSLLISSSIITIYTVWAIGLEESKLVLEFGDQYRRYQRTVPMLIPFIRRRTREA